MRQIIRSWTAGGDWRYTVASLPVLALGLGASYGVYSLNLLFVPPWTALLLAMAFDLTYVGLAVLRLPDDQRRRAELISRGAVAVSVLSNSLSALFHLRPELMVARPLWLDLLLALLHGVPLAVLAYLITDLLHHARPAPAAAATAHEDAAPPQTWACDRCGAGLTQPQYAAAKRYGRCRQCPPDAADAGRTAPAA